MGLDQWAYAEKDGEEDVNLMEWRKHADLQGWMDDLWYEKGGDGDFNCKDLMITADDLDMLERDYLSLETGHGFFWGQSMPKHDDDTRTFIKEARKRIRDGWTVIYTCWW